MSQTALGYIQEKGFEYKNRGKEIILRECPFCRDTKFHFYVDPGEDGLYFCHKCQEKGNLITLQKHFGDYEPRREGGNGYGSPSRKPQGTIRQAFPSKARSGKGLDEKMATEPHGRLLGDPEALQYITGQRGITLETVEAFKLGLEIDTDGKR